MKRMLHWLLVFSLTLLAGCASDTSSHLAQLDKGFGGTGLIPCLPGHAGGDSGFGGTGHGSECGIGGTGVIGTITDFGSIWVNGLEIELSSDVQVRTNLGGTVKLGIGHQVITIARADKLGRPATDKVEVFYPVAGQIETRQGDTLIVAGQTVQLDKAAQGLRTAQPGDWVAISALPQGDSHWLATRIDTNPRHVTRVSRPQLDSLRTAQARLQGTVLHKAGQPVLAPYNLPLDADTARRIREGTLAVVQARRTAQHWQVEALETLRHWRADWRQLHEQLPEWRTPPRHAPESMRHHGTWPHAMQQMHEQMEHMRENTSFMHEMRDQQDMQRDTRSLQQEQETLRNMRDIRGMHWNGRD